MYAQHGSVALGVKDIDLFCPVQSYGVGRWTFFLLFYAYGFNFFLSIPKGFWLLYIFRSPSCGQLKIAQTWLKLSVSIVCVGYVCFVCTYQADMKYAIIQCQWIFKQPQPQARRYTSVILLRFKQNYVNDLFIILKTGFCVCLFRVIAEVVYYCSNGKLVNISPAYT